MILIQLFFMDSQHRKDLKTDPFAKEVGQGIQYVLGHPDAVKRYGIIVLVVLVLGGGYWFYSSRQAAARRKALADAMHVADAIISPTPSLPNITFATKEEKDKAVLEAYSRVGADYRGTQEGAIAQLYVALAKADEGKVEEALKLYADIADSAPREYSRVAQLARAELLAGQNQADEAAKILRSLANDTSALVSKEEAQLALGKLLAKSDPAEARKILEPLRDESRTVVSGAAISVIATLPSVPQTTTKQPAKAN